METVTTRHPPEPLTLLMRIQTSRFIVLPAGTHAAALRQDRQSPLHKLGLPVYLALCVFRA